MKLNLYAQGEKQMREEGRIALKRAVHRLKTMVLMADNKQRHNLKQELEEIKALIEIAQKE
tara:strand:+ start:387 stop:569 length:183 start_codon:yes stop_codon:yes gene_type:complete